MELTDPSLEGCSDDTSSSASPPESPCSSRGLSSPEESTDDIYQVERILKERSRQGKHQFYIKWRGYSPRLRTRRNTSPFFWDTNWFLLPHRPQLGRRCEEFTVRPRQITPFQSLQNVKKLGFYSWHRLLPQDSRHRCPNKCLLDYCCRIPDIFVQISAYYDALVQYEVTCCFYCNNFHPTVFI